MKINNKGFAFTTMIYGILALMTLILYAILNIEKSSSDAAYYYSEGILNELNNCVFEEITLENCYSLAEGDCDVRAYNECLGIAGDEASETGVIISEVIKEKFNAGASDIQKDPTDSKRYIYVGNNPNNYIYYSGRLWRIISVEPDGNLKLIDYTFDESRAWDLNSDKNWDVSSIKNYLNNDYLTKISDRTKMISGKWIYTMISKNESLSGKLSINEFNAQQIAQEKTNGTYAQVGLLSIGDYIKATTKSNCRNEMIGTEGCISWLSEYTGWTINVDRDLVSSSKAFYFSNNSSIAEQSTLEVNSFYPVIFIDRNSMYLKGDGTIDNYYALK